MSYRRPAAGVPYGRGSASGGRVERAGELRDEIRGLRELEIFRS